MCNISILEIVCIFFIDVVIARAHYPHKARNDQHLQPTKYVCRLEVNMLLTAEMRTIIHMVPHESLYMEEYLPEGEGGDYSNAPSKCGFNYLLFLIFFTYLVYF